MKRIFLLLPLILLTGCSQQNQKTETVSETVETMPLEYAEQFSVDFCADGTSVIHIGEDAFLLVPEHQTAPAQTEMTVIQQPVYCVYAAASSAMDLFDAIGCLDRVQLTSTDRDGWSLPHIRQAMDDGALTFIGKYSTPDYEALMETDCDLAVESTMIYHSPAVKEKIEALGIPVLTERSSYESHPLGRMEWMKLYGLILGKYETSAAVFSEKTAGFAALTEREIPPESRKTCAFFSITPSGTVNIRKPGDYIAKMIDFAGGTYIFTPENLHVDENALSTMSIQMESFYETAKNADILIYNSTIEGQLSHISDLLDKSDVFADFRAVQNGDVWCSVLNTFQQTPGAADMIADLHRIFTDESADHLTYLYKIPE